MAEYICFEKIRTEKDFMELKITAGNAVITASAKIYVTDQMLKDLQEQTESFLAESDLVGYWENDVPGIGGPPCVTLKFLPQDQRVLMEIYMELNDGGSFMEHNCRFFVASDRKRLRQFADGIPGFSAGADGGRLILNG